MDTNEFLDFLTSHDATATLGESLTMLIFARRVAAAHRAAHIESQRVDRVRVAS